MHFPELPLIGGGFRSQGCRHGIGMSGYEREMPVLQAEFPLKTGQQLIGNRMIEATCRALEIAVLEKGYWCVVRPPKVAGSPGSCCCCCVIRRLNSLVITLGSALSGKVKGDSSGY